MKVHEKKNQPVKVKSGIHAGKIVMVVDYLVNQYQGKAIDRIQSPQLNVYKAHGGKLDDNVVWARFYPSNEWVVLHDDDLKNVTLKAVDGGKKKRRKDDSQ